MISYTLVAVAAVHHQPCGFAGLVVDPQYGSAMHLNSPCISHAGSLISCKFAMADHPVDVEIRDPVTGKPRSNLPEQRYAVGECLSESCGTAQSVLLSVGFL